MPVRRLKFRLICLGTVIGLVTCSATGLAQSKGPEPVVLEAAINGFMGMGSMFSITRLEPAGQVTLQISKNVPKDLGRIVTSMYPEGYYLLLAPKGNGEGQFDIIRAQVTEVGENQEFTVSTSPEAAAKLKVGDGYSLVRPMGATTARMRALPGVIEVSGDPADLLDGAQLARRVRSVNNLKQIGLAMHNFHSANNRFPAAVIFGPDGKPWHSWRVLILPYLGLNEVFNEYDFNQPWNSEKNSKLIARMPEVYRDPAYGDDKGSFTHYAAVVGPKALFPPAGAKQPSDVGATAPIGQGGRGIFEITDGTSNTIAVVPVDPARKIPWTKPEDVTVGPDFPGLGKPGGIATPYTLGCKKGAAGVAPILYADGSVHLIVATTQPRVIDCLLTYNGGEIISLDAVNQDQASSRPPNRMLKIRVVGDKATATIE